MSHAEFLARRLEQYQRTLRVGPGESTYLGFGTFNTGNGVQITIACSHFLAGNSACRSICIFVHTVPALLQKGEQTFEKIIRTWNIETMTCYFQSLSETELVKNCRLPS